MLANDNGTAEALCAKWMPRKKTTCARTPGQGGPCMTAENMARRTEYRRNHRYPESSESRKKSNRKYRISSYGMTREQFDRLPDAQQEDWCSPGLSCCERLFVRKQQPHVDRRIARLR